jgi:hypothetical protein
MIVERVLKIKKQKNGTYNVKSNSLGFTMNVESIEELEKIAKEFSEYRIEFAFAKEE